MDLDPLTELEAATAAFASAAESNDSDQAASLLDLRGELLERLAENTASLEDADLARLQRILDSGHSAILPLTARRYWLETRIADSRNALRAQNSLRPYSDATGSRLDVTS